MELRWLEDFIALARTRHFSRAAETQNVTQPTFSRRIKLLEEEMRATLVNRQTLPLSLTPEGEEFLALCLDVTERVAYTRQRLGLLTESQAGKICLAAPQSLLASFLPEWLNSWTSPPPVVPYLRATSWLANDYFQALNRDDCDLVLCYWPLDNCPLEIEIDPFDHRILGQEVLIPVSLPNDDGQPRFDLDTCGRQPMPLIAYHQRGLLDAAIRAHLDTLNATRTFNVLNESVQSGNIRELVELGYGLGWLPRRSIASLLAAGKLVRAGSERWNVPLEIRLYRRRQAMHPAVARLWQALEAEAS